MPIYEYRCELCDHAFEALVRGASDIPHCPHCGGNDLAKQFSVPAAAQSVGKASSSLPVCEAPGSSFACGPGQCRTGLCSLD
jgi:putative FmdB family regulatory protein